MEFQAATPEILGPLRLKRKTLETSTLSAASGLHGISEGRVARARKPSRKAREIAIHEQSDKENYAPADMTEDMDIEVEAAEEELIAKEGAEAKPQKTVKKGMKGAPQKAGTATTVAPGPTLSHEMTEAVATTCEDILRAFQAEITELKTEIKGMKGTIEGLEEQVMVLNGQLKMEAAQQSRQAGRPAQATYAATASANMAPGAVVNLMAKRKSELTAPMGKAPLFCSVETNNEGEAQEKLPALVRQGVEAVVREETANKAFKCLAVTRDARNPKRVRVVCRSEEELNVVKRAAEKAKPEGTRVLRDQLWPVKLDNVATRAILSPSGTIKDDALTNIESENGVKLAKIAWLSSREMPKAYGSMAVYFIKGEDAAEALQTGYFTVAGESALARPFLPRTGPQRCFKCQQVGHKAYSCKGRETCAICAQPGHTHRDCTASIPKCSVCQGPHTAFSKSCREQRAPAQTPVEC